MEEIEAEELKSLHERERIITIAKVEKDWYACTILFRSLGDAEEYNRKVSGPDVCYFKIRLPD